MSDGYLVSLLFNDRINCTTQTHQLQPEGEALDECFGSEDDLSRADLITNAIDLLPTELNLHQNTPHWNQYIIKDGQEQLKTPSASSACVAAIVRRPKGGCVSNEATPRVHTVSSETLHNSDIENQFHNGYSTYSSESNRDHHSYPYSTRRTLSGSSASIEARSQISERLQSCLQTDDLNLEGFVSPCSPKPAHSSNDTPASSFQSNGFLQKCQSKCQRNCRPVQENVATSYPGTSPEIEGQCTQDDSIQGIDSHVASHCCHYSHSASWLQLAVGLGETDPASFFPIDHDSHSSPTLVATQEKPPVHFSEQTEPYFQFPPLRPPLSYFYESQHHSSSSPRHKTLLSEDSSSLSNVQSAESRPSPCPSDQPRSGDIVSGSCESVRASLSTAADAYASSPSSFTSSTAPYSSFKPSSLSSHYPLSCSSPSESCYPLHPNKSSVRPTSGGKEVIRAVGNASLATTIGGLLSGRTVGRTLLPGKYAPRYLAAAAAAVPAKICRKLRASHAPPVIPEEPTDYAPSRSGSGYNPASSNNNNVDTDITTTTSPSITRYYKNHSSRLSGTDDTTPSLVRPKSSNSQSKRHQLAVATRLSSDPSGSSRKPSPFVTIPCIQGALSVRQTSGVSSASATTARAAAATASRVCHTAGHCTNQSTTGDKSETAQKGWAFASRLRRLSSSMNASEQSSELRDSVLTTSMCWRDIVEWYTGFGESNKKMWGFDESSADRKSDFCNPPTTLSASSLILEQMLTTSPAPATRHGFSPGCSQQSTTASQSVANTISSSQTRRMASSQRSVRREVGSGVVLGTGDPERDRAFSGIGLQQYIKVARSIRRISRAFHSLVADEGAELISAKSQVLLSLQVNNCETPSSLTNSTMRLRSDSTTSFSRKKTLEFIPWSTVQSSSYDLSIINGLEPSSPCSSNHSPPESNGSSPLSLPCQHNAYYCNCERAECDDGTLSECMCCLHSDTSTDFGQRNLCWCCLEDLQQSKLNVSKEADNPCKASCWAEILIFIQSIFRLQLRQKKLKTLAVADRVNKKKYLGQISAGTVDASLNSTETSCSNNDPVVVPLKGLQMGGVNGTDNEKKPKPENPPLQFNNKDMSENAQILASSYWIVFLALWIEKRMHLIARQRGDPHLVQQFCCCRLFTPADMKRVSTSTVSLNGVPNNSQACRARSSISVSTSIGPSQPNGSFYASSPAQHNQQQSVHPLRATIPSASSLSSLCTPQHDSSFSTRPENSTASGISNSGCCSFGCVRNNSTCCHTIDCCHLSNCSASFDFSFVEHIDLDKEGANLTSNWGSQIDTIRRFLVLCFCAWSWIEDETITSGNVVSILQHIWWCTDTQINLGLSDIARKRHVDVVARKRGSKSLTSSFSSTQEAQVLTVSTTQQRKPSGALGGRVSKIRDAVVSTSGGKLLAQYFGQHQSHSHDLPASGKDHIDHRRSVLATSSTASDNHINSVLERTDYYAEYLALPTSCSIGDFETQVFFLMRTMSFKLAVFPELVISLSSRWHNELATEQCCFKELFQKDCRLFYFR